MTKLQNPIREGFEAINEDLRAVSKAQREFGKALDKVCLKLSQKNKPTARAAFVVSVCVAHKGEKIYIYIRQSFPITPLPTDHDVMADHHALINRAIAIHLLREGQFSVARTFMDEVKDMPGKPRQNQKERPGEHNTDDALGDTEMRTGDEQDEEGVGVGGAAGAAGGGGVGADEDKQEQQQQRQDSSLSLPPGQSSALQAKFEAMYAILQSLKAHDLGPAIDWARANSAELEKRGSTLEFELCKLQFVWLFKQPPYFDRSVVPRDLAAAIRYARQHFNRFQARHLREIQKLAAATVFASNLAQSPYAPIFETRAAFNDVAAAFTREFCSLLGLSAESPLYLAATAGAIALPRLVKFVGATRSKGTEWTTAEELAFETPLPRSLLFHSIFVCPVSKEQTTLANPPVMLPCGHVLARDSLRNLTKAGRFKCPYCPSDGIFSDALPIIL